MGTEANSCQICLCERVGMEKLNGVVDGKQLGIGFLADIINLVLVSLVGCNFDEVHRVTRNGANHNFGYY